MSQVILECWSEGCNDKTIIRRIIQCVTFPILGLNQVCRLLDVVFRFSFLKKKNGPHQFT